jgi:hypothetical protein
VSLRTGLLLSTVGGFLFGTLWGGLFNVVVATLGATAISVAGAYSCLPTPLTRSTEATFAAPAQRKIDALLQGRRPLRCGHDRGSGLLTDARELRFLAFDPTDLSGRTWPKADGLLSDILRAKRTPPLGLAALTQNQP